MNHLLDLLAFNLIERHRLHQELLKDLMQLSDDDIAQVGAALRAKIIYLIGNTDDVEAIIAGF